MHTLSMPAHRVARRCTATLVPTTIFHTRVNEFRSTSMLRPLKKLDNFAIAYFFYFSLRLMFQKLLSTGYNTRKHINPIHDDFRRED
jgi:hypothetical protein